MRIGYLDCFSGISGDMFLGALVDAGVPFDLLEATTAALNIGAHLESRKVVRGGITGTKVDVLTPDPRPQPPDPTPNPQTPNPKPHATHRHLSSILKIIAAAPLSESVKARSSRAFQLLGEAEAAIHSIPVEKVHFHEVGAIDTIVDIVCAAAGAESLSIDRWLASPLNVGSGTVVCQHGTLPVPAPATLALLGDAPVYAAGPPMERVTPTGAAILRMLDIRYEPLPPIKVHSSGFGAGGKDTPGEPNLLRILVGESSESAPTLNTEPIAVLETVIDDSSPQLLGYVSELLLAASAWDVYRATVQMKKGRTGVQLTVLCRPDLVPALRDLIFRETTTIGLHWRIENKESLARDFQSVTTPWGSVRIKIARWPSGQVANASPEYEDCRRLAAEHSIPLKQVHQTAMSLYLASNQGAEPDQ
jgi:hypothetical protein